MKSKLPNIKIFSNDHEKVAQLLCFNAKSIISGNYQKAGIPVLPSNLHPRAVYFPDLSFSENFWRKISKFPHMNLNDKYPIACVNEALSKLKNIKLQNYTELKNDLKRKTVKFVSVMRDIYIFQEALNKVSEIEILISPFGSGGSFFCSKKADKSWKIYIAFKAGNPTDMLAYILLLALYRITYPIVGETGNFEYFVRAKTCNIIFNQSPLGDLFPQAKKLSIFPKILYVKSESYLKKLNIETKPSITISDDFIYINEIDRTNNFTKQEIRVLSKLHDAKGKVVSYDALAKALWGKDFLDKYSLYSISKVVEKLRKKLVYAVGNRKLIFTSTKKGYYFIN